MSRLETTPNRFVSKGNGVDVISPLQSTTHSSYWSIEQTDYSIMNILDSFSVCL